MRCSRKLLGISYRDHITNDAVKNRIRQAIGPYDDILTTVKKRKLKWFGHLSRSSGLANDNFTKNSARREKKEEGADKISVGRIISFKKNQMEGEGCSVRGAPTVTMTTG